MSRTDAPRRRSLAHALLAVSAVSVSLLLAPSASANQVFTTDCSGGAVPQDHFAVTDTVCVSGDIDFTCPMRFIRLPGVDIYAVPTGAGPFSVPGVHHDTLGGAGSFIDVPIVLPMLVPGVYDVILDEQCDGVFDASDVRENMAFTVGGTLDCSAPPGEPVNPGIASGALCRGACGGDCPSSCTAAPPIMACVDDAALCEHIDCTSTGVTCGSHEGCRIHDDCYDACAVAGRGFGCRRECDLACLNTYGLPCGSWARGGGPYDGTITFYDPPTSSGSSPGLCSGSC